MVIVLAHTEVPRQVIGVLQTASAVVLTVLVFGSAPAGEPVDLSEAAVPDGMLGVNGHILWEESPEGELEFLADSGIDWLRSDFDWRLIEPVKGQFDWRWSDNLMAGASRVGIDVLAIVDYSAPWASSDPSGRGDVHYPPRDPADYARFAAAIAQRYGAGGDFWKQNPGLEARPVTAMEVWNEPFGHWYWKPDPDVAAYARLVRETAAAVDLVQPDMRILAAGDAVQFRSNEKVPWLARLLEVDPELPELIDAWAIHPYPDPPGLAPWDTPAEPHDGVRWLVEEAIRVSAGAAKRLPIWITEIGWCTAGGECGAVGELDQAAYLVDVVASVATAWDPVVEKVFVYSSDRSNGRDRDREGNYGLRRSDGSVKLGWAALTALNGGGPLPTVGMVDPGSGRWYLLNDVGTVGSPFYFGNPGDVPFVGDWNCDGVDTPGLYRQSDGYVYLRNSNTQGVADVKFYFGNPGDVPIAGDFDGDGCDTLSVYRPFTQTFHIANRFGGHEGGLGAADHSFVFGNPGDQPVVGDWDSDGIDEIGLYRASTGLFYYRTTASTGNADGQFFFGDPGDRFVAGDWGGQDGIETPAVFRPSDASLYFRNSLTPGNADFRFEWTGAGSNWVPVSGDFGP